ncbi:hypothetical protein [Mongoliitalea daihaiensis]|uniref:hypothetical protein n=1 Tax=Mongoliitalea daihaiensis TaxID=2782006 RepID=UPI001F3E5293|nr:hypothetical protein [Mongoliitalea daihaiensis]UJP64302.1 hypothetical protein IPZ59_16035 [Mongoliitalea daihaiensis]
MKKLFVFAFLLAGLMSFQVVAQDDSDEVTEEEMKKYATMEVLVSAFTQQKQEKLVEMIREDEVLGGGARYNEIKSAWGNEEKMAEISVTDEEKAAYAEIQSYIDSIGEEVKEYMIELIKDPEVLGAATYNKVKRAMTDPSVKSQIDSMIAELKLQATSDADTQ